MKTALLTLSTLALLASCNGGGAGGAGAKSADADNSNNSNNSGSNNSGSNNSNNSGSNSGVNYGNATNTSIASIIQAIQNSPSSVTVTEDVGDVNLNNQGRSATYTVTMKCTPKSNNATYRTINGKLYKSFNNVQLCVPQKDSTPLGGYDSTFNFVLDQRPETRKFVRDNTAINYLVLPGTFVAARYKYAAADLTRRADGNGYGTSCKTLEPITTAIDIEAMRTNCAGDNLVVDIGTYMDGYYNDGNYTMVTQQYSEVLNKNSIFANNTLLGYGNGLEAVSMPKQNVDMSLFSAQNCGSGSTQRHEYGIYGMAYNGVCISTDIQGRSANISILNSSATIDFTDSNIQSSARFDFIDIDPVTNIARVFVEVEKSVRETAICLHKNKDYNFYLKGMHDFYGANSTEYAQAVSEERFNFECSDGVTTTDAGQI